MQTPHVGKVKNYSWKDQYKYVESCRKIYQEENFDLIFMVQCLSYLDSASISSSRNEHLVIQTSYF